MVLWVGVVVIIPAPELRVGDPGGVLLQIPLHNRCAAALAALRLPWHLVQRLRVKFSFDRALCDKSMKLGRHVLWTKLIIFRYRATLVLPACCRGNEFNVQVTSSQKIPSTVATIGHSTLQLLPTERAPDSDPESTLLCSFVDIITGLIVRWCSVTKIARLCLFLETSPIFAPASPNLFWE